MNLKFIMICQDCKKEMPIDTEKTSENWTIYKNNCECGGYGVLTQVRENNGSTSETI